MTNLFELWMIGALPLPIVIGAGVLLAIASNRDKRIRIPHRKESEKVAASAVGDRTTSTGHVSSDAKLPPFGDPALSSQARSISFTINSSQDSPTSPR